jgi:hypothetical protein
MANVKSKTAKAEVSKAPSSKPDLAQLTDFDKPADVAEVGKPVNGPKPSTEIVPDLSDYGPQELRRVGPDLITELQLEGSVSISFHDDKLGDLAVKHGVQGLVDEFAPADAVESTYAPVIIGIRNAVMASLCLATKGSAERRDIELNTAFKGAGVLAQLLQAFDVHRRHGGRRFTVGNVNVESGAQAIVGNVEATPRQEPRIEEASAKPNKHKPRAA